MTAALYFEAINLSATALVLGNMYTLVASIVGTSPHWGVKTSSSSYAGGEAILQGTPDSSLDLALRVTPVDAAAVPEPGSARDWRLRRGAAGAACRDKVADRQGARARVGLLVRGPGCDVKPPRFTVRKSDRFVVGAI